MPSEFRGNAEDLNTSEPVQVDVEAIRARLDAVVPAGPWEVFDNGGTTNIVGEGGDPYVAHIGNSSWPGTEEMAAFIANAPTDLRRLLDENARLNAENERIRAMTKLHRESTARQRHKLEQKLISWREAAADKAKLAAENARYLQIINEITSDNAGLTACLDAVQAEAHKMLAEHGQSWNSISGRRILNAFDAAPEMPRPPAEEGCTCSLTDSSTWTTYGSAVEPGSMWEPNPECPEHGAHTEILTAQERAGDTETRDGDSGTGTDDREAHGGAQAVETIARILVGSDWDNGVRNTDIGPREYVQRAAEQIDAALRPVNYREAAQSILALADADESTGEVTPGIEYLRGMRYAARLLESVAHDLDDEAPSLPAPGEEA